MTLYIVQAEEGSGIPGIPSVFASRADADALYKDLWRDAFAGHRGYANVCFFDGHVESVHKDRLATQKPDDLRPKIWNPFVPG